MLDQYIFDNNQQYEGWWHPSLSCIWCTNCGCVNYTKISQKQGEKNSSHSTKKRSFICQKKRRRIRRSVLDVYNELGPIYFRRAYRMKYESFLKLIELLEPFFLSTNLSQSRVNGSISNSVCLAVALRYFAGGSPYDVIATYGISFSEVFVSVWRTVNLVNHCPDFIIAYPGSHDK